ncbi:MAG: protease modulator HflC [Candidatus Eiseniibacteriota bacterium]|jgi:membrane protease subunit HflC
MKANGLLILVILVILVGANCLYQIDMTEQVIITYFGEPVAIVTEPGLHIKGPFLWKVNRIEKRTLEWDGSADKLTTKDKTFIWVDTFGRWRIDDPLEFFTAVRAERFAQSRLDDIIEGVTRDLVAQHDLIELVRNTNRELVVEEGAPQPEIAQIELGRERLSRAVLERARAILPEIGVELIDVQFKRINYTQEVRENVYQRMISERKRIAAGIRAEGQKRFEEIEGDKSQRLREIESEAYRIAQQVRGRADSLATEVYAMAYGLDPEFYAFTRTLESYAASLGSTSTLIFTTDSPYFHYLKDLEPR